MAYPYMWPYMAPQVTTPPAPQNNTLVWVKTQKEAEDYLVAPNNSIVFMDEAMTHLYMKSADQFGRPTFKVKLLTDECAEPAPEYMTKADFDAWVSGTFETRLAEMRRKSLDKQRKPLERREDHE